MRNLEARAEKFFPFNFRNLSRRNLCLDRYCRKGVRAIVNGLRLKILDRNLVAEGQAASPDFTAAYDRARTQLCLSRAPTDQAGVVHKLVGDLVPRAHEFLGTVNR